MINYLRRRLIDHTYNLAYVSRDGPIVFFVNVDGNLVTNKTVARARGVLDVDTLLNGTLVIADHEYASGDIIVETIFIDGSAAAKKGLATEGSTIFVVDISESPLAVAKTVLRTSGDISNIVMIRGSAVANIAMPRIGAIIFGHAQKGTLVIADHVVQSIGDMQSSVALNGYAVETKGSNITGKLKAETVLSGYAIETDGTGIEGEQKARIGCSGTLCIAISFTVDENDEGGLTYTVIATDYSIDGKTVSIGGIYASE